jgi:hypothetical protein
LPGRYLSRRCNHSRENRFARGFCRQTTSARSDGRDTASTVAIPETATTASSGAIAHRRNQIEAAGAAEQDIDDHCVERRSLECPQCAGCIFGLDDCEMI